MFFVKKPKSLIETERLILRLPEQTDFEDWLLLRKKSENFLLPWEPKKTLQFYSRSTFKSRVSWGKQKFKSKKAMPIFLFNKFDKSLVGGITLDNIRDGPINSASVGYWIGETFSKRGFMTEALKALISYSFKNLNISRIEAATLSKNIASRRLLEKSGFKYEGVAQNYLEINGRWQNHILYAVLRLDRRGKIELKD